MMTADNTHKKEWRERNPEKRIAHHAVENAVRNGTLVKQRCAVCGAPGTQAHHPDYSRPLDVIWLCPEHHGMANRERRTTATAEHTELMEQIKMATATLIAETKQGKDFELPIEGTVQAVLAEVRDLGILDQVYNGIAKKVHKVLFRWQLEELDSEKQPKRVYERFTLSLHEKAGLRKRIKGLFGKEPPATMDILKLVGVNTNLIIVHNESVKNGEKKMYANIAATLKLKEGQAKLEIVAIPKKDEVKAAVAAAMASAKPAAPVVVSSEITDEDIPF